MSRKVAQKERKNEHVIAAQKVLKVIKDHGVRGEDGALVEPYVAWAARLERDLKRWHEWIARAKRGGYKQILEPGPEEPEPEGGEKDVQGRHEMPVEDE